MRVVFFATLGVCDAFQETCAKFIILHFPQG